MRLLLTILSWTYNLFLFSQSLEELRSIGLPLLQITTINHEEPTCEYVSSPLASIGAHSIKNATKVPGRMIMTEGNDTIYDSGEYINDKSGITIKIRGNTSAYRPKKPYKLKLQKKADLLLRDDNRYKDKNWVLLKDEQIKTMIGFKLNELVGLQWTPSYRYVNVVLNGDYIGLYMLCEQVERNTECRLNVSKTGYVFEYDGYWWNEDLYVESSLAKNNHYTIKYPEPEEMSEHQLAHFINIIKTFEKSVVAGEYAQYIDVETFASWMLAQDILANPDHVGSGYFLTKYDNTSSSKIKMANMWDFDDIFHETMKNQFSRIHTYGFFDGLFKSSNRIFSDLYVAKWNHVGGAIIEEMIAYLNSFSFSEDAEKLSRSIILDNNRWGSDNKDVNACLEWAIQNFKERAEWLGSEIPKLKSDYTGLTLPFENYKDHYQIVVYNLDGTTSNKFESKGIKLVRQANGKYKKIVKK